MEWFRTKKNSVCWHPEDGENEFLFFKVAQITFVVCSHAQKFRWLTDQYPSVNQRISEGLSANSDEIDMLYLGKSEHYSLLLVLNIPDYGR
jgi:hypothetical protein